PGLGVKAVNALVAARRQRRLRLADVGKLTVSIAKVRPFIVTEDWRPIMLTDRVDLQTLLVPAAKPAQMELFA
ncbi:MAG: biotin synthase, partial [Novosphingobium sp.]